MFTAVLFLILVAAVAAALGFAARQIAIHEPSGRVRAIAIAVGIIVIWLAVPGFLAAQGALDRYAPLPAPGLAVILCVTAGTVTLALTWFGTKLLEVVPLAVIVGFQGFRVPLELLLHRLYTEGLIPVQMTYSGLNFDIVTGVSALAVSGALYLRRCPPALLAAWNVLGLGLLINIVAVALLSTPVPFRYFTNSPDNLLPSTFPYVWLPTFLVQAALFGHLLVLRALVGRSTTRFEKNR